MLDVFHDRADDRCLSIGNAIDVDFDCVLEKAIDQRRPIRRDLDRARHVTAQVFLVINQLHRAATENERRANENRVADLICNGDRFIGVDRRTVRRLPQTEFVEHGRKQLSIFRGLDTLWLSAEDWNAGGSQPVREIERRLSAELHDHAFRFFLIVNVEHVLKCERLEIKFVARVIISRNRFRIRVHHDGFKSELAQRKRRVHAAVIEFDSLADTVRPAAEDHHFAFTALAPLVFVPVS